MDCSAKVRGMGKKGLKLKIKVLLKLICIALLAMLFCIKNEVYADNTKEESKLSSDYKDVLVLQSYNLDYVHTRDLGEGISNRFASSNEKVELHYEFLDTKNYMNPDYFDMRYREFNEKYDGVRLDAIILCDDDALNFYRAYGKRIWPRVKVVVATGINSVSDHPNGIKGICIIEEKFEYEKNIRLALEQNKDKDIKRLFFIYDDSTTGRVIRNDLQALTDKEYGEYEVYHYNDKTPEQIKEIMKESTSHDLFFYALYFNSPDGRAFAYQEVSKYLMGNTKNPVYGFIDFYLGEGIIGGYVVESELYGEKAVEAVLNLWDGKTVLPIIYAGGSDARLILDNNIIEKYNIKIIPTGAQIMNRPQSYLEKNRNLVIFFMAIIGVLVILIFMLGLIIVEKNKVQSRNDEINSLNLHLIDMQKDIVMTLGEVIETRSNETANHVKRVAQISRILGEGYGLSEQEICDLVMISPMHDIGKIGVPESILNKPGKLSQEEFQVVKKHSRIGYEILKNTGNDVLLMAGLVSLQHHERHDGAGYPEGIKGDKIHIFARITSVADVYDALRSERVYKQAWDVEEAEAYILEQRGKAFDPAVVDVFMSKKDRIREIFDELP